MPAFTFVDQPDRIAANFDRQKLIGVDTEFMRERTFFSQLCLVQLSTDDEIYCVDPLSGEDMADFWQAINASTWVLHSSRQDIEVIYQTAGFIPASIFDTQIAAAMLGFAPQMGYAGLIKELFDVELAKAHTRANWTTRPLPEAYLQYAAEDVEYLLPAYEELTTRLDGLGRLEWAESDSRLLLDPDLYDIDPNKAISDVYDLEIRVFRGESAADVARSVTALGGRVSATWSDTVRAELHRSKLADVASLDAVTTRVPSGLNDAEWSSSSCPSSTIGSPDPSAFQTRAVWSCEEVTTRRPLGSNSAVSSRLPWPRRISGSCEPSVLQMRAVPSSEAVTSRRPSGLNSTSTTLSP